MTFTYPSPRSLPFRWKRILRGCDILEGFYFQYFMYMDGCNLDELCLRIPDPSLTAWWSRVGCTKSTLGAFLEPLRSHLGRESGGVGGGRGSEDSVRLSTIMATKWHQSVLSKLGTHRRRTL